MNINTIVKFLAWKARPKKPHLAESPGRKSVINTVK
jgi:hypothetical protein